jgi:hypothetical protein
MTGTITLDGELELEETTDADGNKAWQIVDENGNRRKLILGEAEADVTNTQELLGSWDRRVSSTSDLESLPSDITAGEVVRVEQPDTPYRPSSWSTGGKYAEIDVSDSHIVCQSAFAKDGQPLVKPADGSNIGGLLIGESGAERVTIERWGFHGNESTMDDTVKRLHGLIVGDNASEVTINGGYCTRLHPWQEHATGGSAVTHRKGARDVVIKNIRIHETGDRGVQGGGERILIDNVHTSSGFDRSISLNYADYQSGSRIDYASRAVTVKACRIGSSSEGSGIGLTATSNRSRRGQYRIIENYIDMPDGGRAQIKCNPQFDVHDVIISENVLVGRQGGGTKIELRPGTNGGRGDFTVVDNVVHGPVPGTQGPIQINAGPTGTFRVESNFVRNSGVAGIAAMDGVGVIIGNTVVGSKFGISSGDQGATAFIGSNYCKESDSVGISANGAGQVIGFNLLENNNQDADGSYEVTVDADDCTVGFNQVLSRGGAKSFGTKNSPSGVEFYQNQAPDDGSKYDISTGTILNGEVIESASAETPQQSYPTGTLVRFTDSGDGSGTGTYLVARDGTFVQVSTDT